MKGRYIQQGKTMDYKNSTDSKIEAGTVVNLTTRVGVAGTDIEINEVGEVHLNGVFEMNKAADEAISLAAVVYYDPVNDAITTVATSNIPAGYAFASALAADITVSVKLLG